MDTFKSSQVQHLREYIVAIQNQLKSFQTQRKTLLEELCKFQNANNNMRLQIDYLVNQLKGLDLIIDQKNAQTQKLAAQNISYQQQLKQMNEALQQKDRQIQELKQGIKETEVSSCRQNRETRMDRQILEIKLRTQVQQQLQPKIQTLTQQIHTLKLQLNQKDFSYTNLEKTIAQKAHSLIEKDQQIASNFNQIQHLKQQLHQLNRSKDQHEREIESLKHLLATAEQNCKELRGDDTVKREVINEQQRVVLVENLGLKKEKQSLLAQCEQVKRQNDQMTANNQQLTQANESLKQQCQYIQSQNSDLNHEISTLKSQLQQMNNKMTIAQNDTLNLTQQNHTLRAENLKLFNANEQLEKLILQLRNEKQLPKAQYQTLKAKLQTRLQQLVQKEEQLKKRHWLEIARYANQIDKLKVDIEERNRENNQLKRQIKEQHNSLTHKEISNQSSVIIYESEKESMRIQLAHEWKEKIDKETLKLQQEINALKTFLQQEAINKNKLTDDLKHKQELIKQRDLGLVDKQTQINILNSRIGSLEQELVGAKDKLNQHQLFIKEQFLQIKSLQLQVKSRDQTITLKLSQTHFLNQQLQQKNNELAQKDVQILNRQNIIRFKDDQLIRKQNNFQMEKQIMNNILQAQIKQALQQKQQQFNKTLPTEQQLSQIRSNIKREMEEQMEEDYRTMRQNLINQIQKQTFNRVYTQYQAQITKKVQVQTQTQLRNSLETQIRQQILAQIQQNAILTVKNQSYPTQNIPQLDINQADDSVKQYLRQRSYSQEKSQQSDQKSQISDQPQQIQGIIQKQTKQTNNQQQQLNSEQPMIPTINQKQLQQFQSLRKYRLEQQDRDEQLNCLRNKVEQTVRVSETLAQQLNEAHLIIQKQKDQIAQFKRLIQQNSLNVSFPLSTSASQSNQLNQQMINQKLYFQLLSGSLSQQITQLKQQLSHQKLISHTLEQQCAKLKESVAEQQLKCLQLEERSLQLQHQMQKIQKLLNDSHEELKAQRNLNIQLQTELQLKKFIQKKAVPANKQQKLNEQLQDQLAKYQQQESEHLEQVNSLKIQLENITNELIQSDSLRAELNKQIQTLHKQVKKYDNQLKDLREFKQNKQKEQTQAESTNKIKDKEVRQLKQQKLNQQAHIVKIKQLESQLKAKQSQLKAIQQLESTIAQLTQKANQQQNLIHEKQLDCQTLQSQLKSKSDELQEIHQLLALKDEQIHELSLKADAVEIKYNSFFTEIQQKTKQEEQLNIYNKKKISQLSKELQQTRKIIHQYQKSFIMASQTIEQLRNELLQKDAKIESLERQAQRTKKYQDIINIKPQTFRQSPQTQTKTSLQQEKNLTNYQKIMKKLPKSTNSQQLPIKSQHKQMESFRKTQQGTNIPKKSSQRMNSDHNTKMISSFNNNELPVQFNPYSIGKIPGSNFSNKPPQAFDLDHNTDSLDISQYEQDYNRFLELHQSFQNDTEEPTSPQNFFTAQYTFYKPNQNISIVSQDNVETNNRKSPLRFGETFEQKLILKNNLLMQKSKSEKLLKNQNNTAKSIKEQINQFVDKFPNPQNPTNTKSTTINGVAKIATQKTKKVQQKEGRVQTQKKPGQKNGGIRKNITQQSIKTLNVSYEHLNSKDVERKVSDEMELFPMADTKSKSKLIRTMKSQSQMIKAQSAIVSNLK